MKCGNGLGARLHKMLVAALGPYIHVRLHYIVQVSNIIGILYTDYKSCMQLKLHNKLVSFPGFIPLYSF